MILRCTKKVLDLLGREPEASNQPREDEEEWYINLLWLDRRKHLLVVHAETLFAIFASDVRKADITPFERFAADLIRSELLSEGLSPQTFGALDPSKTRIARTASRSVLGTMNDMALGIRHIAVQEGGIQFCDAGQVGRDLRRMLHRGPDYIVPIEVVKVRSATRSELN